MAHKILRSNVSVNSQVLDQLIQAHLDELIKYDAHCVRVRAGEAQNYPGPIAHPDVDKAIKRKLNRDGTTTFTVDYELVNYLDVPVGDERALAIHKEKLRHDVAMLEQQAIHDLHPRGKWRLSNLLFERANTKDEDKRTTGDNELIADHLKRIDAHKLIQLHFATLESQIEDLNFDTVNDWVPTPYPGTK